MAERTGVARIDRIIEAFLDETITGSYDDAHGPDKSVRVRDMAFDPALGPGEQRATGWCGATTRAFAHRLAAAGIEHGTTDDDITGFTWCHGYHDMPYGPLDEYGDPIDERLSPSHCANLAFDGEHAYMIDFTASQYGYTECPLVRRIDRASGKHLAEFGPEIDHAKWETSWDESAAA
jgi:hypothetical protein